MMDVNNSDRLQSQVVDFLRFPLIIAVIFIHMGISPKPFCVSSNFVYDIVTQSFLLISFAAVPTFFLFSGLLFFNHLDEKGGWNIIFYKKQLSKRFYTLLIPYFLWNIICLIATYKLNCLTELKENGWHVFYDVNIWGKNVRDFLGNSTPYSGPVLVPYWYLRDLIVVSLLSPFIYYLVKYFKLFGVFCLLLCYISGIWVNVHGLTVQAVFFFSLGSYFSIHKISLIKWSCKTKIYAYVLYVILFLVMFKYGIGTVGVGSYLCSFLNSYVKIVNFLLAPFLCASISVTIYIIMRRYTPKMLGVLTGSRI